MPPATRNQQRLEQSKAQFVRDFSHANDVLGYLRRNGLQVVRVEPGHQGRWSIFIAAPESLREMFDIDLDMLVLATSYDPVEPRILNELQKLLRENARVEDEIAVLISNDVNASKLVRQRPGGISVVTLLASEIASRVEEFRTTLSETLTTIDHFNVTTPITDPSAFFGRERDIAEVRNCLEQGQHVGVFGLRKAGKSSLLNRISSLMQEKSWNVAQLDLNEYFGTPRRFKADAVEALRQAIGQGARSVKLRTRSGRGDVINEYWLSDIEALLDAPGISSNTVLIIDEIDSALPLRTLSRADPEEDIGLLRALTQLRALIQRRAARGKNRMVVLSAGVDPALFERPQVRGRANPLYQFATLKSIEPMDREELQEMVRTLGKRTGMRFRSHELIDALLSEYGGHPLLTRQACSYVHRHRPAGVVPLQVNLDDLRTAFEAKGPGTPREHALDVPASFAEWFEEEAVLLEQRLEDGAPEIGTENLEHAVAYGILNANGTARMRAILRGRTNAQS